MEKLSKKQLKELVKLKQKKYRLQNDAVIVEGNRIIRQLLENGLTFAEFYILKGLSAPDWMPSNCQIFELEDWQFGKISSTDTPQNIAAKIHFQTRPIAKNNLILYLDAIREPGNLGTIFRTAAAAGIDGIVLSPDCCEVFNPKVIRASLGMVFIVPFKIEDIEWLKNTDSRIITTSMQNADNLFDFVPPSEPSILVLGSEAEGIRSSIQELADHTIRIPINPQIESLNVAVAAGIILFHLRYGCQN
jgi:TrmH family RNA methyltransferase